MKSRLRIFAAVALAVVLFVQAPAVSATPKDGIGRDVPAKIVKFIKKLQNLFGVSSNTDAPQPPRP